MRFPRATSVAAGLRPTNDHRLHRSRSTDSSRNPGASPTTRAKAATGVVRSARTSRQTGTTLWPAARAWNSSLLGRSTEGPEEARVRAGVARPPAFLLDDEQQGVAVAVVVGLPYPLAVARRLPLAPPLLPGAAPEDGAAGLQRLPQRRLVHPRQVQHLAGAGLLHDGGDE